MFPARIIEAVDILEDGDLSGHACLPRVPPDQFCLDGFEEGFHHGIVVAVALAAHRYLEPILTQDFLIVMRAILAAPSHKSINFPST